MALTHRLQLLLEESQYQRLSRRAHEEGRSVGSLVREAIDLAWAEPDAARQAAADVILLDNTVLDYAVGEDHPLAAPARDLLGRIRSGEMHAHHPRGHPGLRPRTCATTIEA